MILFLKPYFEVKPWAGKELNKIYDCPEGTGEAWIVSGYRNKSSIISNGKYKGQTLRNLWINKPELFGNYPDKEFPLLLKLISIAILISQCFGCSILFWMTHKGQNIRIHLRNFTPSKAFAKEIIFGGTPSLSRQGCCLCF